MSFDGLHFRTPCAAPAFDSAMTFKQCLDKSWARGLNCNVRNANCWWESVLPHLPQPVLNPIMYLDIYLCIYIYTYNIYLSNAFEYRKLLCCWIDFHEHHHHLTTTITIIINDLPIPPSIGGFGSTWLCKTTALLKQMTTTPMSVLLAFNQSP